jgi:excisionase family DNA binding protein
MDYISTTQAAEKLKVSRRRVLALIAEGRLPAERLGREYLIRPKDLAKVKDRKPGRPPKAGPSKTKR